MNHRQVFCQSCGMPMTSDTQFGTEADGSRSPHYCSYCYRQGQFTAPYSMEEMIDFCAAPMAQANPGMSVEQAKQAMRSFFPTLLRWK